MVLSFHDVTEEKKLKKRRGNTMTLHVSYLADFLENKLLGFFVVVNNITRLKELERERRECELKFVAASKMSSLNEMAAGIAHEINNPLAIINGKISLLKTKLEKGSSTRIVSAVILKELFRPSKE